MLVRHLSYFVTLAKEQHFARAAEICCVAQPTLSAAIRKLEDDLEIRLVVRGHRYLGLTPEGQKVLEWARQILTDYDGLRADLAGLRGGLSGQLRIGVVPAAIPIATLLTDDFLRLHAAATIDVRSMTSGSIQKALDMFEIDAGLTYLENEALLNVRRVPLYHERYVLIRKADAEPAEGESPETAPSTPRRTMSWKDAAAERLCLLSEDMQNRRILNNIAASLGLKLAPKIVSNSFLSVCSHVRHGGWSAIVPHTFLPLLGASADLTAFELVEPAQSQAIGLVLSDRDPLSPMASALLSSTLDFQLPRNW